MASTAEINLYTLAAEAAGVFAVSFSVFLGSYHVMFFAINELHNQNKKSDHEVACHSAHIDGPDLHVTAHASIRPLSTQRDGARTDVRNTPLQREGRSIALHKRVPMRATRYTSITASRIVKAYNSPQVFSRKRGAGSKNQAPTGNRFVQVH